MLDYAAVMKLYNTAPALTAYSEPVKARAFSLDEILEETEIRKGDYDLYLELESQVVPAASVCQISCPCGPCQSGNCSACAKRPVIQMPRFEPWVGRINMSPWDIRPMGGQIWIGDAK